MMMRKDGGPAFPQPIAGGAEGMYTSAEKSPDNAGMTLRDWFAGMALAGWLASFTDETMAGYECEPEAFAEHMRAVAETCYEYADAMLAERERGES